MEFSEVIYHYLSFLSEMFWLLIILCIFFINVLILLILLLKYLIRKRAKTLLPQLRQGPSGEKIFVVGFFHPYCNAGGGGERVLWVAIRALQNKYPNVRCLVYTGDCDASKQEILHKAQQRFNIVLPKPVEFVFLRSRNWVEAKKYPFFTLLGQSLGSVILGWEAVCSYVPDLYIDSMGYAFTLPLFKYFGGCKVACYVHYPTISTDMLQRVSAREESFNNRSVVSRYAVLTYVKVLYYRLFAYCYGLAGNRSDAVMVNSTWTYNHIKALWGAGDKVVIVYPPCDISEFISLDLTKKRNGPVKTILSIAQFRPEKNHQLQLESLRQFLDKLPEKDRTKYKLLLVGGSRNAEDARRVEALKQLASDLNLDDCVEFKLNVSFQELKSMMEQAVIGLHTMRDEHFGIGVVELMAAGTMILAHDSAGPKMDIVVPYNDCPTGFLAADSQTYADKMWHIFQLSEKESLAIRQNARLTVERFSEAEFDFGFLGVVEPLLDSIQKKS